MSLRPGVYDEAIELTAAMRVAAGQIPHRDFYANYGPAQFYILAGLFKLFGTSLLTERLFDLFVKALTIAVVYAVANLYCRSAVALGAGVVTALWIFGLLNGYCSYVIIPVSLLNLLGTVLLLPVFRGPVSTKRVLAVGSLAGLGALFRYDTGLAIVLLDVFLVAIAICLRSDGGVGRLRTFGSVFWPYLVGLAIVVVPPAIYYLSVAPLHPFIHDAFIYPSKYYVSGRRLPFPRITLKKLDNIAVYLIFLIAGIAIYFGAQRLIQRRTREQNRTTNGLDSAESLFAFGCLALGMYFKGWIRLSLVQEYLSIVPSAILLAILIQKRNDFSRLARASILALAVLFAGSAAWSSLRELKQLYVYHISLPENLLLSSGGKVSELRKAWCKNESVLTKGICFLPEDFRIETIEFITQHTNPEQKLFSGVAKHDRIFDNDLLIYFATQRLPATRWAHFDPGLQSRFDIQEDIVRELQISAPPYIVRDSEPDPNESNASSVSSGVTFLDDYLDNRYERVETFGALSIWKRKAALPEP